MLLGAKKHQNPINLDKNGKYKKSQTIDLQYIK
ncbi:MAG: hypothetical protein JWR38_3372 [Mucilaginibacter sp.]|nr:hypothetical protein [Mucilaginibacter sp.]